MGAPHIDVFSARAWGNRSSRDHFSHEYSRMPHGYATCSCIWPNVIPRNRYPQAALPHMCEMMLSPNAEHLISVAPSINRAKS